MYEPPIFHSTRQSIAKIEVAFVKFDQASVLFLLNKIPNFCSCFPFFNL